MNRRQFTQVAALAAILGAGEVRVSWAADAKTWPDFFDVINARHSVRVFTDEAVSDADIEKLLSAAMLAPSAANEQPWEFIVIRDKEILGQVGAVNRWASYAKNAPVAILVCLNTQKEKEKGMGILDIGICSENIMLGATALGLGSTFTGIYPYKDRMEGFARLCNLPDYVQPIGLIILGHPKKADFQRKEAFNPQAIHQNKW